MIFVLTVHHLSGKWLPLQTAALARWLPDAQVVAWMPSGSYQRLPGAPGGWIVRVGDEPSEHGTRLNALSLEALRHADPEDILLTLDSDAWPIADPMPTVERLLARVPFVAVRRDEAEGARQPHPCFSACRAGFWSALPGDWTEAPFTDAHGRRRPAVGGRLLERLGDVWAPLLRCNRQNPHPVMFGLYGDTEPIVYHHGAGSREPSFLHERRRLRGPALPARIKLNRELSEEWYQRAVADEKFWHALMAEGAA
jgi:hypothetical protein